MPIHQLDTLKGAPNFELLPEIPKEEFFLR